MILIDDMNIKPAQFHKVTIPTRTYSPTHIHHYAFEPVHQSLILLINVSCFTKKKKNICKSLWYDQAVFNKCLCDFHHLCDLKSIDRFEDVLLS